MRISNIHRRRNIGTPFEIAEAGYTSAAANRSTRTSWDYNYKQSAARVPSDSFTIIIPVHPSCMDSVV